MIVVIPFRCGGKSRLPAELRGEIALAMLGDVVEAALAVGAVRVVTDDPAGRLVARELGAVVVDDRVGVRVLPSRPRSQARRRSASS